MPFCAVVVQPAGNAGAVVSKFYVNTVVGCPRRTSADHPGRTATRFTVKLKFTVEPQVRLLVVLN